MNNKEFTKILNHIEKLIENKEYEKVTKCIKAQKIKLLLEKDLASDYIDDLVKKLK